MQSVNTSQKWTKIALISIFTLLMVVISILSIALTKKRNMETYQRSEISTVMYSDVAGFFYYYEKDYLYLEIIKINKEYHLIIFYGTNGKVIDYIYTNESYVEVKKE